MTSDEAIQVADEVLLAHAGNPLTDIQRMILSESLAGTGYESMTGYAPQHIKNEGKKLWDLLSEGLGETVSKKNFKGALEKRFKSGGVVPKPPQPSNYDQQTWAGRTEIVNELLPKLQGQTCVLWLTGMSGIGKTTLGECLASQAWETEPSFQWIYLEILEGQSTDFASVVGELLSKLGDRNLSPQELNNADLLAKRLLQKLQTQPYWIQLDSLERLLKPNEPTEFADAYWVTFLRRCLTETNFASRLVLTAQALPTALMEFGDRYPRRWAEIQIGGLSDDDQRLDFFAKRGLVTELPNRVILTRIAQIYEGHPLVLKVIAEDILKVFRGDVNTYWQTNQREFEQVAKELQEARLKETEYNKALDLRVRERIKKSLEQLPVDALDLLCRSSVFRRPVPEAFWLAMIEDRSRQQQRTSYQVLSERTLIETETTHIRQHNLIRDIAYDLLKPNTSTWETAERQAAHLWLTAYQPAPNAENLETVRGYLEAIDHYCVISDWDTVKDLFVNPIDTPAKSTLSWQLDIWGYFQEEIRLCQKLLGKCGLDTDLKCWRSIGNGYIDLGNYSKTIEAYENSLRISRTIGDRQGEGNALGNLGLVYKDLGNYSWAIDFHQQALIISREIGDRQGEGCDLGGLGNAYYRLGNYAQSIDFNQKYLAIAREVGDRRDEGIALVNIGESQLKLEQYPDALTNNQAALTIFQEIGDRANEVEALKNLAELHQSLGKVAVAQQYCQQALALATELDISLKEDCEQLMTNLKDQSLSGGEK
jgi:tetratricopeptide (TPR) repeat protein